MKSARLNIRTRKAKDVLDITSQVEEALGGAREGLCALFVQHTTAALAVGEAGEGTDQDLLEVAQKIVPRIAFRHGHDPSHAPDHMASSLLGPSLTIPVLEGWLALGTWQRVLLVELNGPRERSVVVQFWD